MGVAQLLPQPAMAPAQMPLVQRRDFAEALTAQWDMHSGCASLPASPSQLLRPLQLAAVEAPSRRSASASNEGRALPARAQQQQLQPVEQDGSSDIMAFLLGVERHAEQNGHAALPDTPPAEQASQLSPSPRPSMAPSSGLLVPLSLSVADISAVDFLRAP